MFLIDIIVNFRTTFFDEITGEEIYDKRRIAIRYLKGYFILHFLSIFPFAAISIGAGASQRAIISLGSISLLRMFKLERINKIIFLTNIGNVYKTFIRLGVLILFIVVFIHTVSCLWYQIVLDTKEWLPPLDYVYITTEFYDKDNLYQYWTVVYHVVLLISNNDIGPRGEFQ